jgi:hypothetical protein
MSTEKLERHSEAPTPSPITPKTTVAELGRYILGLTAAIEKGEMSPRSGLCRMTLETLHLVTAEIEAIHIARTQGLFDEISTALANFANNKDANLLQESLRKMARGFIAEIADSL